MRKFILIIKQFKHKHNPPQVAFTAIVLLQLSPCYIYPRKNNHVHMYMGVCVCACVTNNKQQQLNIYIYVHLKT